MTGLLEEEVTISAFDDGFLADLERPHLWEFDGTTHRVQWVSQVAGGHRPKGNLTALLVDVDDFRGRRSRAQHGARRHQ